MPKVYSKGMVDKMEHGHGHGHGHRHGHGHVYGEPGYIWAMVEC